MDGISNRLSRLMDGKARAHSVDNRAGKSSTRNAEIKTKGAVRHINLWKDQS